ncbi:hypothetical protein C8R43DRAFT_1009636 [Mycena crocata]|nr:hypothetical protein C8R43DRAFT_1009636 [Mycena crocata]
MPTTKRTITMVHRITGQRINIHEMDPTPDDRGVPDACRACGKSAKDLGAQNPPITLMCCTRCKTNGNVRVLYCSKACQTVDYRHGKPPNQPPHKRSCGKTHVEPIDESLLAVSGALDPEKINLYTKSPTTALQSQVEFLANNPSAHYGYRRVKNGKYVAHQIQGKGGELFLRLRTEAMERREPASIALMEKLLAMSTLPTDTGMYTAGDYVPQLEQEYEVDLEDCHRALEESVFHQFLFDQWVKWATPRIRNDKPALGVRFLMPWYYLLAGKFIHPVKYRAVPYGMTGLERR